MLATLALTLAAAQFAPATDLPFELHGECIYPPALVDAAQGQTLVLCNTLVADRQGIAFGQRGWDAQVRFFGTWHGRQLRVSAVEDRTGRRFKARGDCRIDFADGAISMIACSAAGRGLGWIANFHRSTI